MTCVGIQVFPVISTMSFANVLAVKLCESIQTHAEIGFCTPSLEAAVLSVLFNLHLSSRLSTQQSLGEDVNQDLLCCTKFYQELVELFCVLFLLAINK